MKTFIRHCKTQLWMVIQTWCAIQVINSDGTLCICSTDYHQSVLFRNSRIQNSWWIYFCSFCFACSHLLSNPFFVESSWSDVAGPETLQWHDEPRQTPRLWGTVPKSPSKYRWPSFYRTCKRSSVETAIMMFSVAFCMRVVVLKNVPVSLECASKFTLYYV